MECTKTRQMFLGKSMHLPMMRQLCGNKKVSSCASLV